MLRLRTLGTAQVIGDDGTPLGGAASQRRLLALLSLLAVAGEAGMTRDRILGLLWPDGDAEKSRHALTQSLYHARRVLGCGELFLGSVDIRLNPSRISSDIGDLEAALNAGDLEGASTLYAGPFLDGFFLAGSGEFEQWMTTHRARIADRMVVTYDRLAASAESRGRCDEAIAWRKRQFALDPLSSTATVRLLATMAAAGDRAGALQQARVHQLMVRDQLDVELDPSVQKIVERLRHEDAKARDRIEPEAGPDVPVASAEGITASTSPREAFAERNRPVATSRQWRTMRPRVAKAIVAIMMLTVPFLLTIAVLPGRRLAATVPTLQPLVVAPFRVTGADPSLAYLRDGLVELLSIRLAEDSLAHAIDAGAVLSAWRTAQPSEQAEVPHVRAVAVARRLGAAQVVVGSVVGNASRLVVSASLVAVATDIVRAQVTVEGPSDSLTSLVNRLASKLIAASAGEDGRFSDHTTPLPSALRAYLDGQSAYRRGDYAAAVQQYERALSLDSTFALAALHLALASDQINDAEQHDRALALAWANRRDLNDRDRVHLIAFAGPRYPAPSSVAEQLAAWEQAVARSPDRAEVWHELGERFFHHGAVLGLRDGHDRAAAALRRALDLDPSYVPSRQLLVLLAARTRDSALLARAAARPVPRDSLGHLAPSLRWRTALARGDQPALLHSRGTFGELDDANLRLIGMASLFDADGIDDGERALRIRARRGGAAVSLDALLATHALALNQGRPVLALDITEQIQERMPGLRAHLRLRLLDAMYGDGDTTAAREAAATIAHYADARASSQADMRALQLSDQCVLEQWRLARGLTSRAPRVIAALREAPAPRTPLPVSANQRTCAEILEAMWSVATRQPDAPTRVARLDSLMLGGPAVSDAGTYAHIVVARLYVRLGQPARALEAIRNRTYMTGWPRYLATARREEGGLAALVGDWRGAATSYREYLALRSTAERASIARDMAVRTALSSAVRAGGR